MRPANRRYYLHSILPLLVMTVLLLLPRWLPTDFSAPLRNALLLLPLLPFAFVLLLFLRYLRESDELERKVEVEALGLSAVATMLAALGGLLLSRPGGPAPDTGTVLTAVLLAQIGTYWLVRIWLRRRYQ